MIFLNKNWKVIKFFLAKFCLLFLLTMSIGSAQAEPFTKLADELIVAIPEYYPPYYILDEDQNPAGFAIDVFEAVALRAGIKYRYDIQKNWSVICEALYNGEVDIVPTLGLTAERQKLALFTSAVETFPVSIFVRTSNIYIKNLEDLDNKVVAVVQDECGYKALDHREEVVLATYNNFDTAFQSLISGQVDAMIYSQTVMEKIIIEYDLNDKITTILPPLMEVKRGMGVRKSAPQLREKLEIALQAFLISDDYKKIYQKWFVVEKPFWNVEKVFWSMVLILILVIVVFVVFRHRELMLLNASLQQQIDEATLQLSQSNDYLRDLTITDTLTGITNRRAFENSLQEFMSRAHRYGNNFSMLIFDIDDFKRLNDQYGHDMGDRVLVDLVDRIREIVRDVDVLSRWGGEEFTILMMQTEKEGALRMAERCRHAVADTLFDEVGPVTISLGVTCYQEGDNERRFFKRADDALYQAKAEGKNRVVWIGDKCRA